MGRADSGVVVSLLETEGGRELFVACRHPRHGGFEQRLVSGAGPADGEGDGFEEPEVKPDDGAADSFEDGIEAEVEVVGASPEFVGFEVVCVHEHVEKFHVSALHIAQSTGEFPYCGVLHDGRLLDVSDQAGSSDHSDECGEAGGKGAFHRGDVGWAGKGNQRKRARVKALFRCCAIAQILLARNGKYGQVGPHAKAVF